jgi:glucose-1-phosphate cytidylyltransferase
MKVVLFCGGLGLRLRDYSDKIPKPMVPIGPRPILWHLMRYYAHYGHKDFVLCLGHKGESIKRFFLEYDEWLTNDFVLNGGEARPHLMRSDISDWRITFVDTGLTSNIGERLLRVRQYLGDDEIFLANYSDNLTAAPLDEQIAYVESRPDIVGSFMSVVPALSLHSVNVSDEGYVTGIQPVTESGLLINGGFFVFRNEIFDYMQPGEELVAEPFGRLIEERRLVAHRYPGFWAAMDTFKDWQNLDELYRTGHAPWEVWKAAAPA